MRLRARLLPLLVATATLNGCGINAVIVESAGSVAELSEKVADEADDILTDAQERRDRALIALVASDSSCSPTYPIFVLVPDGSRSPRSDVPLCADGSADRPPKGYQIAEVDLSPITKEAMRPTIKLIAAAADYGEALTKIVERPKTDVSAILDRAMALAQQAQSTATALSLSDVEGLPEISAEQKSTAAALIQMIADLAREQRQVRDIRVLFDKSARQLGRFCHTSIVLPTGEECQNSGIYGRLGQEMKNWSTIVAKGSARINTTSLRRAYDRERQSLGFEGRVAFVTMIQEAEKEKGRIDKASDAFGQSLATLSEANRILGRQLTNPSKEDRQKAAEITRQRIFNALSLVLKAASAWKVF